MSFVERVIRNLPVRQKADKQTVDALQQLAQWAEDREHQTTETLKLLNRALVLGEPDALTRAYGAVTRLRETGRGDQVGTMELLQDKLLERMRSMPERDR